jgi:shikimate kinase
MNIVLIGMRGSGKSNISRRLSVCSKRSMLSTDILISYENQGDDISTILEKNRGDWRVFRELEYLIVKKIVNQDNLIIDTGGGILVDLDENDNEIFSERKLKLLKKNGLVIWLKGDVSDLAKRVKGDPNRPTLVSGKPDSEAMARRIPFYEKSADIIIDIDGKKRKEIVLEIMGKLCDRKEFPDLAIFSDKMTVKESGCHQKM